MISIKNIWIISTFEAKVLWRNWFFRIISILGVGFLTIFNLAVFSELNRPQLSALSNSWTMPFASMLMISIPQVAAVIFLATGLIKKDRKLDTNEVFFVRPITNLDYVFGKALALFKLFFLLNIVLLTIPLIVNLTSPFITFNPMAYIFAPLLISIPSIVFTVGLAFLLVTLIKNQPITIILILGAVIVQLIYYSDQFSNILDFKAFRLPTLPSDMIGFVDIEFAIWQRSFYFLIGVGFLFITAFFLDRLSSHRQTQITTGIVGIAILTISALVMIKLWGMRQNPMDLREEMISVNGKWADIPNIDIISHAINIEWTGDEIAATSEMVVKNKTGQVLNQIYFTLNPGLTVNAVSLNGQSAGINRDLQIVSIDLDLRFAPGQEMKIKIKYDGAILASVAHLEVDQKRYESVIEFGIFSLQKKYAFLQDSYVLLTNDVLWYPDTQVGYSRKVATKERLSFVDFALSVKVPESKVPISQGEAVVKDNIYQFKSEYPLPQISLVIGDYDKKELVVDSVVYVVYHYPKNDFFLRQLDQLGDTLGHLIRDNVNEYEDAQQITYPFRRLQFVEVPIQFTAYNKIYKSHQAYLQPEMVFWPEEGGKIDQFDFRTRLRDMNEQASRENQVLTDKQKQANVFNDLVKNVYTKQQGANWVNEKRSFDDPDFALFPHYYAYNTGVVSRDWPLLNRGIATYLRNDKQARHDYSRNANGISFAEECNILMRKSSLAEILTVAEFNKIGKSISLKNQYLFLYLGQIIGERTLKAFLFDWVDQHQHELTGYETLRKAIISKFDLDIDPIIKQVYQDTTQAAFEVLNLQQYEVMDGDRKRYQVLVEVKNSGENDGVIEIRFNTGNGFIEMAEEFHDNLSLIKQGEIKLLGFALDEKPKEIHINTVISKNIPSVITLDFGTFAKSQPAGALFEGERTIMKEDLNPDEVIVDNEGPGFASFSPIKPTLLKAYLDSRASTDQKYYGVWARPYSKWLATTSSDFYGTVIRSAHFTRSGNGEKIATWTPEFKEDGFYDIYTYMKGKNQKEYQGRHGDNREFNYNYVIQHADGKDNVKYNISNAKPGWNYLGSYYFKRTGGSVSLTDECELGTVYADAIKWVKQ